MRSLFTKRLFTTQEKSNKKNDLNGKHRCSCVSIHHPANSTPLDYARDDLSTAGPPPFQKQPWVFDGTRPYASLRNASHWSIQRAEKLLKKRKYLRPFLRSLRADDKGKRIFRAFATCLPLDQLDFSYTDQYLDWEHEASLYIDNPTENHGFVVVEDLPLELQDKVHQDVMYLALGNSNLIQTPGKIANAATSVSSANVDSKIVLRDAIPNKSHK